MSQAGKLRDRVVFQSETSGDDGYGNVITGWTEEFTVPAQIRFLRGSEPVIAARLTGVQPVLVTVRASSETRRVDTSWRVRNARTGKVAEILAVTPSDNRHWIDLLCEDRGEQPEAGAAPFVANPIANQSYEIPL